nr:uncharacterized protein LOC111838202 [Paramormyrops kingsleyae]
MAFNQNFLRESQHQGRLMKKIKEKKKEERSQYAVDPSGWTRAKGLPCNTRLQQMDGHFRRVGLDRVSAWGVTSQDPEKFRRVLMEKSKKKIKVMDFIEKRMKSYDVNPQGLSKYTDFLLHDCYRLRNVHSIKDFTIEGILQQEVSVIFTFEDMKLVAYVCLMGNWKYEKDFALLPLDMRKQCAKILPSAILSKYGPPSKMGGIYSICHPDGGGVDPSSIFEERKCLVIFPNDLQLMNRELRYISCSFNRPLGCIIFEEICRFINRASHSAGVVYFESHGKIRRVTEYNVSTYSVLEYLFKERIEMKRESKYTVSVTEECRFLLGASVCCICVNGLPEGTGFLLFDRYILTNVHVIKSISNEGILKRVVSVMFTIEDMKGGTYFLPLNVKQEVVAYVCSEENWQWEMDFALLELDLQDQEPQILPPTLLSTYGPPSEMGGISICGHPGGGGKRIDESSIIEKNYLVKDPKYVQGTLLHYHTTMRHGSSGSPIFGDNSHLLGMHTGYLNLINGSVTEFGIPMNFILQNLLLQMIEQNKREPLLKCIREAMKGGHTIVVIAKVIWDMLGRQDVEGVLSAVITTAETCYEFQELSTLLYNMGQTDFKKLMILQRYFPSFIGRTTQ